MVRYANIDAGTNVIALTHIVHRHGATARVSWAKRREEEERKKARSRGALEPACTRFRA